jgi:hypothetical protein
MKMLAALMSAFIALAIASSASAGSTIKSGYGGVVGTAVGPVMHKPNGQILGAVAHKAKGQILGTVAHKANGQILGTVAHNKGTLPFTGLNLATFVAIALLLIAIGFVVTRMSRRRDNT